MQIKLITPSKQIALYFSFHQSALSKKEISGLKNELGNSLKIIESGLCKNRKWINIPPKTIRLVEFSLTICGKQKIKSLNQQYRHKDKITDVLSFPIFENLRRPNQIPHIINLGDIVICHQVARTQATTYEISFTHEVIHLFIHGFLHLLGYDHEISSKEEKIMFKLEDEIVRKCLN